MLSGITNYNCLSHLFLVLIIHQVTYFVIPALFMTYNSEVVSHYLPVLEMRKLDTERLGDLPE